MSNRYGESRRRAQLELRAAAARLMVDAELLVRWLDQQGGEPSPRQVVEERHADVLRGAHAFEAALNHLVELELLVAVPGADAGVTGPTLATPGADDARQGNTEPKAKARRTISIAGDPDKPKPPRPTPVRPQPPEDEGEDAAQPEPAPEEPEAPEGPEKD
jgi:hypothetical protein